MDELGAYIIGFGGLLISAITLITAYLRNTKKDAAEGQVISDKLDSIFTTVGKIDNKVDRLDNKLDDHANRITKIETRLDNLDHRVDKVEERCERHFGRSQPNDI